MNNVSAVDKWFKDPVKSLGLVFGDIGTSPIYTMTIVFHFIQPTAQNVFGIISLITWTMITLVMLQYAWLAMSIDRDGQGGTIVLKETLVGQIKGVKKKLFLLYLSFIGIALIMGDGIITPAISILSAVEGLPIVPGLEHIEGDILVVIAVIIAICLFSFQSKGVDKITKAFGPVMVLWFLALAGFGLSSILSHPNIILGLNPWYGIEFLLHHKLQGFLILSSVFLCATGGEALYADMGHINKHSIRVGWYFAFTMLLINYLGQGAFLINHPQAEKVLFEMVYQEASFLYIPFLFLSITATIIASQAMISGMFSIVYQGITTRMLPMLKINYTSLTHRSQIYIGFVNWAMLFAVILIMVGFKDSSHLGAAYGVSVSGDMVITCMLLLWLFIRSKSYFKILVTAYLFVINLGFFIANTSKIHEGGYWSIIIASCFLSLIVLYNNGNFKLYKVLRLSNFRWFIRAFKRTYRTNRKIPGTAIFFTADTRKVPPYIERTIFDNRIIFKENILIKVTNKDTPFGLEAGFTSELTEGLKVFEIVAGYMEFINIDDILQSADIKPTVIFYGFVDIETGNPLWKIFALIKRMTPSFVEFYKLPPDKLHGVITKVHM